MFGLDHVVQLLIQYKYLFLFPIAVVEGPIISIISGFLVSTHILNPFITYGVLVSGDIVGDSAYYVLGRYGGERFIIRWGHYFGADSKTLSRAKETLTRHGSKLYVFGKVQGLGSVILMAAGAARMPFLRYIMINTLITFVKTLTL